MVIVYVPISEDKLTTEMRDYDISGYMTMGKILSSTLSSDGIEWISVEIYYDCYGKNIKRNITLPKDNIVKTGYFISNHFYHRSNLVHATKFFNKNLTKFNDRKCFGSGIYGNIMFDKNSTKIIGRNLYQIQSSNHLDMLTLCSINTQKFVNGLILTLRDDINKKSINKIMNNPINSEYINNLFAQWYIFFIVNNVNINKTQLEEIIFNYVLKFKTDKLYDDSNNEPIFYLIVNDIIMRQGYDGIVSNLSDVLYPCVLFDYSNADKISVN